MENELSERQNNILAFLAKKDGFTTYMELSLVFGMSRSAIAKIVNIFMENGLVDTKLTGRSLEFKISDKGRNCISELQADGKLDVEKIAKEVQFINLEESYSIKEDLKKIEDNVKSIERQMESKLKETDEKINEVNSSLLQINKKLEAFYGRIGEILTLIIASISIIVFNIKVLDTTKVDLSKPKTSFLQLLAIDTPLLIILVVATLMFHFVISKKIELNSLILTVIIIIALCILTLAFYERVGILC